VDVDEVTVQTGENVRALTFHSSVCGGVLLDDALKDSRKLGEG
jgi:hypothetical protein